MLRNLKGDITAPSAVRQIWLDLNEMENKYQLEEKRDPQLRFGSYFQLLQKGTLAESKKELSEILKNDPLCYKEYCSTKGQKKGNVSFDDRSYIRFLPKP